MGVTVRVPLVVDVLGDVETDAVVLEEADIEDLGLQVVSVVVSRVRTVGQQGQLYVSLGQVTVETTILVERILEKEASPISEY